jgi:hypothetical protein
MTASNLSEREDEMSVFTLSTFTIGVKLISTYEDDEGTSEMHVLVC